MAERRRSRTTPVFRSRLRVVAVIGALALLIASGLRHAGTALVVSQPLPHPDGIVTLASHEWERLPMTARMAAQNPEAVVVLTLPQPATEFNCHDCANRVDRLRRLGVNPSRVRVVPLTVRGTYGEALATHAYAVQAGLRRLLVVTSPYHTRRALATFRRVAAEEGIEIGIQPVTGSTPANPPRWWGSPYDRWYVRYEWAAVAYYSVRYGINPLSRTTF